MICKMGISMTAVVFVWSQHMGSGTIDVGTLYFHTQSWDQTRLACSSSRPPFPLFEGENRNWLVTCFFNDNSCFMFGYYIALKEIHVTWQRLILHQIILNSSMLISKMANVAVIHKLFRPYLNYQANKNCTNTILLWRRPLKIALL